jgi:hypothetical protein
MKLPKVQAQRERGKLGSPSAVRYWTEDDDSCLGADSERAVFKVLGRTAEAVSLRRQGLGIRAYRDESRK